MDFGIGLPITGPEASPERIADVAQRAERAGLGAVWAYERLLRPAEPYMLGLNQVVPLPEESAIVYDPLETLAYLAATTSTIRLGTSVIDALYHPPVVLAKRLATLDRLSGGRLWIGLGQGWMAQEFEAAGVPVSRRGAGFAEHVAAMRACWGPDPVSFSGRFYTIPESQVGPKPAGLTLLAGGGGTGGGRAGGRARDGAERRGVRLGRAGPVRGDVPEGRRGGAVRHPGERRDRRPAAGRAHAADRLGRAGGRGPRAGQGTGRRPRLLAADRLRRRRPGGAHRGAGRRLTEFGPSPRRSTSSLSVQAPVNPDPERPRRTR
ncbi:LLM class flavin-dependent oxidoreductase [Nonomuraea salmonea]|uniref:LLM class flavin-dependent oxidoreductase n=1 Tax=Nonomuraea salmonea TaxID=46181 RepID=UPI0031F06A18